MQGENYTSNPINKKEGKKAKKIDKLNFLYLLLFRKKTNIFLTALTQKDLKEGIKVYNK